MYLPVIATSLRIVAMLDAVVMMIVEKTMHVRVALQWKSQVLKDVLDKSIFSAISFAPECVHISIIIKIGGAFRVIIQLSGVTLSLL